MTETLEFAGDRMKMVEDADGKVTITFDNVGTGRQCGDCNLCCKLLPIPPLHKPAGVRCQHSRHKGCTIYKDRPMACRTWSCRWLADPLTKRMPRPDRCHYVIDMTYDFITAVNEDGTKHQVSALQVWIDPAFPDAHRAPELRAFMLMMAEKWGVVTTVRFDSRKAVIVLPPPLSGDGEWHERWNGIVVPEDDPRRDVPGHARSPMMVTIGTTERP
jgi:hypothetical protein